MQKGLHYLLPIIMHFSTLIPVNDTAASSQQPAPALVMERCTALNNGAAIMRSAHTPAQRSRLFFAICLPTRLLLSAGTLALGALFPRATAIAAIVVGSISAIYNSVLQEHAGCRWWFPGGTAALGAAAVAIGVLVLTRRASATLLGGLVLAHAAGGAAAALALSPWSPPTRLHIPITLHRPLF